jgi:hypothetical protein
MPDGTADQRAGDPIAAALFDLDSHWGGGLPRGKLIEVRDCRDGLAHLIADADHPAICGRTIVPASLVADTGPECPHCHGIVEARQVVMHRQAARAARRRRWWRR